MKIMIVDDNSQMRKLLRTFFEMPDVLICECSNGLEAVEQYGAFLPDYVLMDIDMPVMWGTEAARRILASFPDASIIMISFSIELKLIEEAMKCGVKRFFSKDNLALLKIYIKENISKKEGTGHYTYVK